MAVREYSLKRRRESGVTLVESALILVLFFTLLFGVMEAGRFLNVRQVLTHAAREGARFAIAPASGTNKLPDAEEISAKVDMYLAAANIRGATTTVKCPPSATESCTKDASMAVSTGSVVTEYTEVTVSTSYSVITVPSWFKALQVNLSGKALMRRETSE
jgi:Flp pilus assembly protein TadG